MSCLQMMLYEGNAGRSCSSNLPFKFDFGRSPSAFDCQAMELNENGNYVLLVGNHELQFINFEWCLTPIVGAVIEENSITVPCAAEMASVSFQDMHNVHRPIVQWNPHDVNQYALAVDRLVRFYHIAHSRIYENSAIVDTHHQRPISTISYWPNDAHCFLTGALDGQVQIWDTRHCSSRAPATLRETISTPFSIRQIQWASRVSNNCNQLAVQGDRCVRVYDMRQLGTYLSSIEHAQRILSMDWTAQSRSIVTLSKDNSLRIFATSGQLLAESTPNEQLPFTLSKVRTTPHDSLLICTARDTISSTYGFTGWRWDEDHYLRPLTDGIVCTSPASIIDFRPAMHSQFLNLFTAPFSSRANDDASAHFPLIAWSRDEQLRLFDMDSTFRQTWQHASRVNKRNLSEALSSTAAMCRQTFSRSNSSRMAMDAIEDEITDPSESDLDDSACFELSSPQANGVGSSETSDEIDTSIRYVPPLVYGTFIVGGLLAYLDACDDFPFSSDHLGKEVTLRNEFHSLNESYGPYIVVELKDDQRHVCILRCMYPFGTCESFRIYLFLSPNYPIVSYLHVRFAVPSTVNIDERFRAFQSRIQTVVNDVSCRCFYYGQLCLHTCLGKLKQLFNAYYKQERLHSKINSKRPRKNQRQQSAKDSTPNLANVKSSNTAYDQLSPSPLYVNDSQVHDGPSVRSNPRTCGARFGGGSHLICFGRTLTHSQQQPASAPPLLNDGGITRPSPFHMRSISLTMTKSRGNSGTDDQPSSYRSSTTTLTNTMQIQHVSANQRAPMFSAPVRSSLGSSLLADNQRVSTSLRRSFNQHLSQTNGTVAIYDISILLPISKKLADDYKLDLNNLIVMCQANQRLTRKMGKYELSHCWRLLVGLLALQSTLADDDAWFRTPMAHGLIKHLIAHSTTRGDIQSASMFLLTMLQTSYMKRNTPHEQYYDSILYSYASLLHRWKHFYKRTQILQRIDHNCQTPTVITQTPTSIICSICLQPVVGQHFLCAHCAHGGHLLHMHEWFSSSELKHRYCPEKDCTCRCMLKQQELLTTSTDHVQKHQHTPTLTPKLQYARKLSISVQHL